MLCGERISAMIFLLLCFMIVSCNDTENEESRLSNEAEITSFTMTGLADAVEIKEGKVMASVLYGTDLVQIPTVGISAGATIAPEDIVERDFGSAVKYTVVAEDGTSKDWEVIVTVLPEALSNRAKILTFELDELQEDATITRGSVEGVIKSGTDLSSLKPKITVSEGATISPDSEVAQDFTDPVEYVITSEDGTIVNWIVMLSVLPSNTAKILAFELDELFDAATITDGSVEGIVKTGQDLSSLIPTIRISDGASISPASEVAQDFTSPVEYTITAEDGTEVKWIVNLDEGMILEDFEGGSHIFSETWNGGTTTIVNNPNTTGNSSAKVGELTKTVGPDYNLSLVGALPSSISNFDLSRSGKFKILYFNPNASAAQVQMKIEIPGDDYAVTVTTTKTNQWEELIFDFSDKDLDVTVDKLTFFFDYYNSDGSRKFYLDDFQQILE